MHPRRLLSRRLPVLCIAIWLALKMDMFTAACAHILNST